MARTAEETEKLLDDAMDWAKICEYDKAEELIRQLTEDDLSTDRLRTAHMLVSTKTAARGDFEKELSLVEQNLSRQDVIRLDLLKYRLGLFQSVGDWELTRQHCEMVMQESPEDGLAKRIIEKLSNQADRENLDKKIMARFLACQGHQARLDGNYDAAYRLYRESLLFNIGEMNTWHGLGMISEACPSIINELSERLIEEAANRLYRHGKNKQVLDCWNILKEKASLEAAWRVEKIVERINKPRHPNRPFDLQEMLMEAHRLRQEGEYRKAEEIYFRILSRAPEQSNVWDGLRIVYRHLGYRFLEEVCPPPNEPVMPLKADWVVRMIRSASIAHSEKRHEEAEKLRTITLTVIRLLGGDDLPLVLKARKSACREKESSTANFLDQFIFRQFAENPQLIDCMLVHDFSRERSVAFVDGAYNLLKKAEQEKKSDKSYLFMKLVEIALRKKNRAAALGFAEKLFRLKSFSLERAKNEIEKLFSQKKNEQAGVLLDKLLEKETGELSLWNLSFQIGYALGEYERCKSAFFMIKNEVPPKKRDQLWDKLNRLRPKADYGAAADTGHFRKNPFWDGTARNPGDIVASRVTGLPIPPRSLPAIKGEVKEGKK